MGGVRQPAQGRGAERGSDRRASRRAGNDRLEGARLSTTAADESRRAILVGVVCYVLWGLAPLLFILLGRLGASPWEIVAQRAVWAAPCAGALALLAGQGRQVVELLRDPKRLGLLAVSAVAIGTGWSVYVWAVNHGHNLDAALGYYLNPLMNMVSGAVFFRERMSRAGWAAVALAAVGVALQAIALGGLPWIALVCAGTFWIYGLIRKQIAADALPGLTVECLLMAVPGLALTLWLAHTGHAVFGQGVGISLLMSAAGPVTVAPLALFTWSARRLPLSAIGFLQFISPTMGFALGVFLGEPLSTLRIVSFGFIWAGAAVFAIVSALRARSPRRA